MGGTQKEKYRACLPLLFPLVRAPALTPGAVLRYPSPKPRLLRKREEVKEVWERRWKIAWLQLSQRCGDENGDCLLVCKIFFVRKKEIYKFGLFTVSYIVAGRIEILQKWLTSRSKADEMNWKPKCRGKKSMHFKTVFQSSMLLSFVCGNDLFLWFCNVEVRIFSLISLQLAWDDVEELNTVPPKHKILCQTFLELYLQCDHPFPWVPNKMFTC